MVKSAIIGVSELFSIFCILLYSSYKLYRLCGFPPFYDEDNMVLFEKIKRGQYEFPAPSWDNISSDAKSIIRALLVVDPNQRMTPDELLRHPWVLG
jgi:serine/threonine protein kinase